jgi:hypothetical protein
MRQIDYRILLDGMVVTLGLGIVCDLFFINNLFSHCNFHNNERWQGSFQKNEKKKEVH